MNAVTLRPADSTDRAVVTAMEEQCFAESAWTATLVRDVIKKAQSGEAFVVIAEVGEQPIGYAIGADAVDVAELHRIAVLPEHRRSGAGKMLLDSVEEWARRRPLADRMLLEVREDNAAALGFYARAGFAEVDRRRGYYRDGAAAVVLRKPLGRGCGGAAEPTTRTDSAVGGEQR